jgi:predicted P-loop ATPase
MQNLCQLSPTEVNNRLDWMVRDVFDIDVDYCHDLAKEIISRFLYSLALRAVEPGVKCDFVLVLQGPQRRGKSTFLESLCENVPMYSDGYTSHARITDDGKRFAEIIKNKWIVEFGELAGVKKADVDNVKNTLSQRVDEYRPAYGAHSISQKRTCVFVCSTNDDLYLTDPTGAGRFFPLKINQVRQGVMTPENIKKIHELAMSLYRMDHGWVVSPDFVDALEKERTNKQVCEFSLFDEDLSMITSSWQSDQITVAEIKDAFLSRGGSYQDLSKNVLNGNLQRAMTKLGFRKNRSAKGIFYQKIDKKDEKNIKKQ